MKSPTYLLTAGCSYSQPVNRDQTWPLHLEANLPSVEYISHNGHGAAGNQTISRKVISVVLDALEQGISPDQMLVGIMWSACDRQEHYSENYERNYSLSTDLGGNETYAKFLNSIENNGFVTPTFIHKSVNKETYNGYNMQSPYTIRNSKLPAHYILNPNWKDELTMRQFENFVSPEKAIIETCEHILRIQWFLKEKGIRYFMTEYDFDVFTYMGPDNRKYVDRNHNTNETLNLETKEYSRHSECISYHPEYTKERHFAYLNNPEINYLYNEIDKNHWLPINNLQDWVTNVSKFKHRDINPDTGLPRDPHPSTEQHKDFVNQIILPFLLEKYNIQ